MSTLAMPPYPAGTAEQKIMQQYSYLFQMSQQLNLALSQLEKTELRSGGSGTAQRQAAEKAETQQQYQALKSMIIKTADRVEQSMEQLSARLSGEYVAASEFGSYMEKLNAYIEANPEAITQYYSFFPTCRQIRKESVRPLPTTRRERRAISARASSTMTERCPYTAWRWDRT